MNPVKYVTEIAGQSTKVAAVAAEVGYDSEAAFNRAFKKAAGVPPGAWRRRHAGGLPSPG
jgi:AraC-like DNA-binding protein